MSSGVKQINPKKDAFLISSFSKAPTPEQPSHNHAHSYADLQPLETTEADIKTILNQPLSNRANSFYDDYLSGQMAATLESTKPWLKDPNYFQNVHISSLALLKMTIHARSGGSIEIMGMLTGKIVKNGIAVMDVYPLPVEGTETRVNAQAEGYEFMVQYLESLKKTGRYENIVGWYHSHPGYGCWLSGIDVSTQSLNQTFQDPYLAIVVDPERTISQGKVEIGAFRTYSDEYVKNNSSLTTTNIGSASLGLSPVIKKGSLVKSAAASTNKKKIDNIPEEKAKDFGLHASKYYSLSIEIFRSKMDHMILQNLWSKFWINNLLGDEAKDDEVDPAKREDAILNRLNSITTRLELLKKTDIKQDSNQRPRKPRFTSVIPAHAQTQLSPFTKANIFGRFRDKTTSDSDETDSEMNDADSDTESRQDDDDEDKPIGSIRGPGFAGGVDIRRKPKFGILDTARALLPVRYEYEKEISGVIGEGVGSATKESTRESKSSTEVYSDAADAGRCLSSLKLQEILFLNE